MIALSKANDLGVFKYLILFFFFTVGLGIENGYVNIAGNFSLGDLGIFLTFFYIIFYQKKYHKFHLYMLIPSVFGVISLMSIVNVIYQGIELNTSIYGYLARWFYYSLLLFVLSSYFKNLNSIGNSIIFILLGFLTQTLIVWINWYFNGFSFMGIPTLAYIENYNANTIGFYSSIAFALSLSLFYIPIKINKNLHFLFVFFLLILFFITGFLSLSKGAWVCILLTSMIYMLFNFKVNSYSFAFLLIAIISLNYMYVIYGDYFELVDVINARIGSSVGSNAQRADMFFSTFRMLEDFIWLGGGPKSYELFGFYYVAGGHMSADPHTAIGGIFAELGIFAGFYFIFIIFLLIPVYLIQIYYFSSSEIRLIVLPLFCFFITLILFSFLSGLPASDKLLWLLIAVIYSIKTHKIGENHVL